MSELAAEYGSFRERGALAVIRASESAAGQTIPAALRAILERCLAVRPADRYRRGLELAEDLNRWRADLPLAYAVEPFWAQTVPRCARRHKKRLLAAGLTLVLGLFTSFLVASRIQSLATFQEMAEHKLGLIWDDIEFHAVQYQRQWTAFLPRPQWSHDIDSLAHQFSARNPRLQNPDSPEILATATHALTAYDVFGRGDWRQRADVRNLPQTDRDDLTLWLMEQTFLYCRALGDRPASPGDWRRAINALDRVSTSQPLSGLRDYAPAAECQAGPERTAESQAQERVHVAGRATAGPRARRGTVLILPGSKTTCSAWPRNWKATTIRLRP